MKKDPQISKVEMEKVFLSSSGSKSDDDPQEEMCSAAPPKVSTSKVRCVCKVTLVLSLLGNAATLGLMLYFFTLTGTGPSTAPVAPPPPQVVNSSCPFSNRTLPWRLSVGEKIEVAAFDIGSSTVSVCWPAYEHVERDSAPFQIQTDDFFSRRTSMKVVWAGSANQWTIRNLLPGQTLRLQLRVRSHVHGGADAESLSDIVVVQTEEAEFCGNPNDLGVWRNGTINGMGDKLETCTFQPPSKRAGCIEQALGLSAPCSKCFAAQDACVLSQCVLANGHPCLSTSPTAACSDCNARYCAPAQAVCAGVPLWVLNVSAPGTFPN